MIYRKFVGLIFLKFIAQILNWMWNIRRSSFGEMEARVC